MVKQIQKRLALAIFTLIAAPILSAQEQADSLVRLISASFIEQLEAKDGSLLRKAVDATFLHNGTTLICDSALWHTEQEIINCMGNVRLIQGETQLTSDKLDYLIQQDLAQFRGSLVQLRNAQENILRTRVLDYNTKDSVAVFSSGASMRSEDGQLIESDEGHYYNAIELFSFRGNVNMYTDSTFVRTTALDYDSAKEVAHFNEYVDFWRDDNMLSANKGWYKRLEDLFFFEGSVHGMTPKQESWSDSLYYYRLNNDVLMLGSAQVQDTTRSVVSLSDYLFYQDSLSTITLRERAAIALWSEGEDAQVDTTYMGADTIIYRAVRKCDIPLPQLDEAKTRRSGFEGDPVSELRRRAAEEAARKREEAERESRPKGAVDPKKANAEANPEGEEVSEESSSESEEKATQAEEQNTLTEEQTEAEEQTETGLIEQETEYPDSLAVTDTLNIAVDSLDIISDTLSSSIDSLSIGIDSLALAVDSLERARLDSLALADSLAIARADSLANLDTTRIGFITGIGDVKIFRQDMQVSCDSLEFCELDSIARFYISPLVWNEEIRQYSSDSLYVRMTPNGVDKAYLISNAFIAIQEDSTHYDQIKSLEVMAYFDGEGLLSRFDALGGANAIFYLTENEALSTVNKVEAKMLSANFTEGEIDRIYYFENPKNDAYPIVQIPEQDRTLKGLNWQIEKKPNGPKDISTISVRPTQRRHYEAQPKASFVQTEKYFPGYLEEVKQGLVEAKQRKKERRNEAELSDSLALKDSLTIRDSLAVAKDSLVLAKDSLALASDSLVVAQDSVGVVKDSLAVSEQKEEDWQSPAELRRALRIARRDARWAEMDKKDEQKAAAKAAKAEARKKRKEDKAARRKEKQDAKEAAILERYIEYYKRQKDKEDVRRKQEAQPSGQREQGAEAGGELQAPIEREG